jgi:hypothetical protein
LSGGALGLLLVIFFRHEWDPVFDSGETAGSDMRQLAAGDDDPGPAVPGASNSAGREETAKDFGPLILETLARGEIRLSMDDAAEMLEDWIFADPDAALKFLASLNESRESYSLSSEDFRELLKTIVRGQDLRARSFRQAPEIAVRLGTDVLKGGEQTWFLGDLAHIYFGSLARDSMDGARNLFSTSGTALLSCYHPG